MNRHSGRDICVLIISSKEYMISLPNIKKNVHAIQALPTFIVREPVIGLIKWFRPKGLKVCSYVEKCAEFKNQTLKKSAGTLKCYARRNTPGVSNISK